MAPPIYITLMVQDFAVKINSHVNIIRYEFLPSVQE